MRFESVINNISIGLGIIIILAAILNITGVAIGRVGYPLVFSAGTLFCMLNGILYYRKKKWIGILLFFAALLFFGAALISILRLTGRG